MSYTVLARRYRSRTFDDVVGQDHVARTLKKAIESDRIAHAYLFCGTRGVGKTSMARILAKALNCQSSDGPTTEPCGKCSSCDAISKGGDLDVIEIDAASNTQVEKTRDIIDNAQYRPAHSRFKVYIIDEVHMLSKASFNALLKTLEEPPEHVKFILATTEPEKVLPTILSRCQRYDFRNIPTREIADHLKNICKQEKIKADDDALLLVAKAGAGSMRDSLSLLDRLLSIGEKQLTIELIEQSLGMPRTQVIFDLTQSIGEGDIKATLEGAEKLMSGGLSADTLVASLSDHLRNLLILRTCGPKSNLVEVPGVSVDELVKQAQRFDPVVLTQDIAILEELRRGLRSSQAGRALLDATLVRLALAEQFASVGDLISRVNGGAPAGTSSAQKKKFEVGASAGSEQQAADSRTNSVPEPEPFQASASPAPSVDVTPIAALAATSEASAIDDDDALPAVGKVWENDSGPSLSELLKQQEAASSGVESPPASTESNLQPVASSELPDVWNRLIEALAQKGPSLPALLVGARLVGIEDGLATLRYPHDHQPVVRMLERNGKKDTIREVLSALLDQSVGLKFEIDPAAPEPAAAPVAAPAPARPRRPALHEVIHSNLPPPAPPPDRVPEELKTELRESDELIRAVMDTLGGDIVKVE